MSSLIEDEKRLREVIGSGGDTLVLFYASWCGFSRAFLPVYEKHACGENCYRVLTDKVAGAETEHSIDFVPTVIFFSKGKKHYRLDGVPGEGLSEAMLLDFMQSCRSCKAPGKEGKK